MKKAAIIHTSFVSVEILKELFAEIMPDVSLMNIVDDSLLAEVIANGSITPGIVRRICGYALEAERQNADIILNQCSSVGEAVDIARTMIKIPYVKIDKPMGEKAVSMGKKIGVIATVSSTVGPSCRLLEQTAVEMGKEVDVKPYLVDGALDVLMKEGNRKKHNKLVLDAIKKAENECDVILLAQGSMIVLLPELSDIKKPLFTSPRLGVENVKKVLSGE